MAPQKQDGSASPTSLYIRTCLWMGKAGKPVTRGFIFIGLGTNTSPRENPIADLLVRLSASPLNLESR